jgi:hypothetical protein
MVENGGIVAVRSVRVQCRRETGGLATWTKVVMLGDIVEPGLTKRFYNVALGPMPPEMSKPVCEIVAVE